MKLKKREKVIISISILAGLLAVVLLYGEILSYKKKLQNVKYEVIIVAKKDLLPGSTINKENLIYSKIPERYFSSNFIKRGDENFIVGAIVKRDIKPYKPISSCQIIPFGGKDYYISKLPSDVTPLTLSLDPESQIGGMVKRSGKVDIYLFSPLNNGQLVPLVGGIKVVWIEKSGGRVNVTVALKGKELYKVMIARNKGVLWIIPSRGKLPSKPIAWDQLMGVKKRKKLPGVQILRGQ